jgi:hypothetical protein
MAFPLVAALMKGFKLGATGLGLMGGAPVGAARAGAGALNLLKQAYTPNAMGLMNLGMDAIPLAMDIANNDVGLKSFSSFGGTMLGTKFGGRELNRLGEARLEGSKGAYARNYAQKYAEKDYRGNTRAWEAFTPNSKALAIDNPQFREEQISRAVRDDINLPSSFSKGLRENTARRQAELLENPKYSRQGYNMAIGFGADAGLYSLTAGMNKPR